jgi:hypothetical protein|tara:strand:+ start:1191 stop:1724 length:534 start_codon:yes stop_codon:yes gene_type:complete
MYFQEFPTIIYDSVGDGNFKDVKNLLRRVGLRVAVRTNILLYDTYDVKEGETPEIIASKLYGDPELHWVILMINNVTDRFHQWPLSTPQFLDFINDKYSNPDGIHHYEVPQSSGNTKTKIEIFNEVDEDAYTGLTPITNREYEENRQDDIRQIRLIDPTYVGQFVSEFKTLMKETAI